VVAVGNLDGEHDEEAGELLRRSERRKKSIPSGTAVSGFVIAVRRRR
jgi:hypothetical protein